MLLHRIKLLTPIVTVWLSIFASASQAADYTWKGGDPTHPLDWNIATNWMPKGIPGEADCALIGQDAIVNLPTSIVVDCLTLDAGSSITGDGTLTVNHRLKAEDATLDGLGVLNLAVGCEAEFDSILPPVSTKKNNKGKRKIVNKGIAHLNSGDLVLASDFENSVGAVFNAKANCKITWSGKKMPHFKNLGQFIKSDPASTTTISAPFDNSGTVIAQGGTLDLGPQFTQTAGTTTLDGGDISSNSPISFKGGTLEGTGKIQGNVVNSGGHMKPGHSPGAITILGNFTQTANGTLDMQIAGLNPGTEYDQISVQGSATLAGTLNLTFLDNFQPSNGDSFTLMEYWSSSGSFSTVTGLYPGHQAYLAPSYTPSYFLAAANSDATSPTVSVANPLANALKTGSFAASGTAEDTGSGIDSVTVRLFRYASSTQSAGYWNGSTWDDVYNPALHERKATGTTAWNLPLPKLPSGRYNVRATANDKVQNSAVSQTAIFTVDNSPPVAVAFSAPSSGAYSNKFPIVKTTASDDADGSGINRVELSIKRMTTNTYWTGSGWGNSTVLPTSYSSGVWNLESALPTGADLTSGFYQLTAKAFDNVGLNRSVTISITIDSVLPSATVTTPANAGVFKDLLSAKGTASDGLSGVASVTLRLYRYASSAAPAAYWDGSSWGAIYNPATHELPVTGTTSWNRALLPASSTRNGKYYLKASVHDRAGNIGVSTNTFWVDSIAPQTIAFISPTANSIVRSLSSITGTATDNTGGQGIAHTDLQIRRLSDLAYWSGSDWRSALSSLSTTQAGTQWSRVHSSTTALPTGANLSDGKYTLTAVTYDKAGNSKSTSITITVDATLPTIVVVAPQAIGNYKKFTRVSGTASDAGVGLSRVTVRLYRYATTTAPTGYWGGGTNWTSVYDSAVNELLATGTTSWSLTLPVLPDGRYYCLATATDKAANKTSTTQIVFSIDNAAPSISVTQPAVSGALYKSLASVSGKASDTTGLSRVTVRLYRFATATTASSYWAGGTNWTSTYDAAANELLATGTGTWNLALPALSDGRYYCLATAVDKAGNKTSTPQIIFTIDTVSPTVSLTQPSAGGAFFKSLSEVSGKAADNSGISRVTVRLYRYATAIAPTGYWGGGTNWTSVYDSTVNELLATGTTSWSLTLPVLPDGRYYCLATTTDSAGNKTSTTQIVFSIDTTAPAVSFTTPISDTIVQSVSAVSGKSVDSACGTDHVDLLIQRGDGKFWSGADWVDAFTLATVYSDSTKAWSYSGPLPSDTNLPDGIYALTAKGFDKLGNLSTAVSNIIVDHTTPQVAISQPSAGALQSLSAITGTASDDGSGVNNVTVMLFRSASGTNPAGYWNGTSWDAVYDPQKHQLNSVGTTAWSLTVPPLTDGKYSVRATAHDNAKNYAVSNVSFTFDSTAPESVAFSSPQDGVTLDSLPPINGTAHDNGSGIAYVDLLLQRDDGLYWNGTDWSNSAPLTTGYTVATGAWALTAALPSAAQLSDGRYTLTAQAFDSAGNSQSAVSHFTLDTTPPVVSIETPSAGGVYVTLDHATGTATDSNSVSKVTVSVHRDATLTTPAGYWNGSGWDETYNAAQHELTTTGTTSWSLPLPTLDTGTYTLRATAFDAVGNFANSGDVSFTVAASAPVTGSGTLLSASLVSPVELSTATASGDVVQLVFTGALDVKTAVNVASYVVLVNDSPVNIAEVRTNSANDSVTLRLTDSLFSGEQITVQWLKLLDAQKHSVSGHIETVATP